MSTGIVLLLRTIFAMVGPEGERHWGKVDFIQIKNEDSFCAKDGFSVENGTPSSEFFQNEWEITFRETYGNVLVDLTITIDKAKDL